MQENQEEKEREKNICGNHQKYIFDYAEFNTQMGKLFGSKRKKLKLRM